MNLPPLAAPGLLSTLAFIVVLLLVIAAAVQGLVVARRPAADIRLFLAGVVVWMAVTGGAVLAGVPASGVPGLLGFFVLSNLAAVGLACSPVGRWWAQGVSLRALVVFQGFRLPLEIVLHAWVEAGTIPGTMTWTGSNVDIVTGIVALAAAPWANRPAVAWTVNAVGFVLLVNVARVAMLSAPVPFGWGVEPPLVLAMWLPYAWIVPIAVGGALAGHIVLTRALLGRARASQG